VSVDVEQIAAVHRGLRARLLSVQTRRETYTEQRDKATTELAVAKERQRINAGAQMLLSAVATERQTQFRESLETLVTHGLRTVFADETLRFHIVEEVKRGRPHVEFEVESVMDGQVVRTGVLDARGGGLAGLVGFFVRLSVLLLGGHRRIMLLDETFAQLSTGYEPQMAAWLADLCDKAQVQIVMVTHSDAYSEHADVVYETSQISGITQIERIR
jgi:hypothetical protein